MKEPKCSYCKKIGHYKINCFDAPRTPIKKTNSPLKRTPIKRHATKTAIYPSKPKKSLRKPLNAAKSRRKQLIKELDSVFSKYIRKRDEHPKGYFRCCSCMKIKTIDEADAGHYISRRKFALRWDERNVNAECKTCNRVDKGHLQGYRIYLEYKYGTNIIELLELTSKRSRKFSTYEIEEMIKHYKDKLLNLS